MQVHSPMSWWGQMARLACVLAGVGLSTTRLGLIVHELVGHGGVAIACGGTVTEVRLFWFAGGWIHFELPRPYSMTSRVLADIGGIGIEFVIGLAVWFALARRESLVAKIVRATGAAIVIHAAWYLAVGTYHGFGDGALIRYVAGDGRYAIAIGGGIVVLAFAYFGARSIFGVFAATISGGRRARVGGVLVAVLLAGGLQGALIVGEMHVRRDQEYGAVMRTERDRVVAREVAQWEREQKQRGAAIDEAQRRARELALAKQHRELPFGYILGALTVLAILAGAWRARPGTHDALPPRLVWTTATIAVGSIALVIAIDAAFA
jgi:hypothetical protein